MSQLVIHTEKAAAPAELLKVCPFRALEFENGKIVTNAACRMCRVCVKRYPEVFEFIEDTPDSQKLDKSAWRGIAVVSEITEGRIHPVTFELIGKARELAAKVQWPVYCLLSGFQLGNLPAAALEYGADEVFFYDDPALRDFRVLPFAAALEDFIRRVSPSCVLVGGTQAGRSLAPRVAARFRTGLTADCTRLDLSPSTNLDQIRPAYGGNIMAHINTPHHRPQFATVRYKVFSIPEKVAPHGRITRLTIAPEKLVSAVEVLEVQEKTLEKGIEEAEVLIVAGRGLKKREDLVMLERLASLLGGRVASTRALVEAGWTDPRQQIGLSGRTVKPKLIITCGVSGAIQFVAGMDGADRIIAINTDEHAPIFQVAHVGIAGDLYRIVPALIERLEKSSWSKF